MRSLLQIFFLLSLNISILSANASILNVEFSFASEICFNGIDDDNDGYTDCNDPDCYSVNGCFEICNNGIDDNNDGLIDGDDPQCSTSSCVHGGLESNNRLADKIAQRNFNRLVSGSIKEDINIATNILKKNKSKFNTKSNPSIADFVAYDAIESSSAYLSTPEDLTDITNASEVFSADIWKGDRRIASVLSLKTEDGVYEHTKYICDRMNGAKILGLSNIKIHDMEFILVDLIQAEGTRDLSCSFSAFINENDEWQIESHWNLDKYSTDKVYYNFQIWANDYVNVVVLMEGILQNLQAFRPITNVICSETPNVYVSSGQMINDRLELNIINTNKSKSISLSGNYRETETSESEELAASVELNGETYQKIEIRFDEIYDMGLRIKADDSELADDLFFAAGSWGISSDDETVINDFEVRGNKEVFSEDVFVLNRNVEIDVNLTKELSVFRSLSANFRPQDLTNYNALCFKGDGFEEVEVTIIKASVTNWVDQYRMNYRLAEGQKDVVLSMNDFEGANGEEINLNDVEAVLFTFKNDSGNVENRTITIENLRFENIDNLESLFVTSDEIITFPNPAIDHVNIGWDSDYPQEYTLQLINVNGTVIMSQNGSSQQGYNNTRINRGNMISGMYYVRIIFDDNSVFKTNFILHR